MNSNEFAEHTANNRHEVVIISLKVALALGIAFYSLMAFNRFAEGARLGFYFAANMSPSIATAAMMIGGAIMVRSRQAGDMARLGLTWAAKLIALASTLPAAAAVYAAWQAGTVNPEIAAKMSGKFALGTVFGAVTLHAAIGATVIATSILVLFLARRKNPACLVKKEAAK